MPTVAEWIRTKLIESGDKGVCLADLHTERKANYKELGLKKVTGIYHSFAVFFSILIRLGWVEKTGLEEVAHRKGTMDELNPDIPRKYFRITPEGLAQPESAWFSPIITLMRLYPERYPKAIDFKYKREKHKGKVILDTETKRFAIGSE